MSRSDPNGHYLTENAVHLQDKIQKDLKTNAAKTNP